MALSTQEKALWDRTLGLAPTGSVTIRDFDQGVVETLGAKIVGDHYLLDIPGIEYPPGIPGIIVTYIVPEELFQSYVIPLITVSRDDLSPAMQRWHPGTLQYRAPAAGSVLKGVRNETNFAKWEESQQAVPFDLTYTISILTRNRQSRTSANKLLDYVLRIFAPYSRLLVTDSIGDLRSYECALMGVSPLDEVAEVAERSMGFAVTIQVEGELDLTDPVTNHAVTTEPQVRLAQKG